MKDLIAFHKPANYVIQQMNMLYIKEYKQKKNMHPITIVPPNFSLQEGIFEYGIS